MHAVNAYKKQQAAPQPRVDVILFLYRKALEQLDRAAQLVQQGDDANARPLLTKVQLIVNGLGAGLPINGDATAANFSRLYEFIAHKLDGGTLDDIDAAKRVLTTLLDAFDTVREQAIYLEVHGQIPSLEYEHQVQLTV
jgi:flagellin-specific chaperone FliS